jgi:uncharacterized protein (TIGR00299 family) protein
LKHIYAAIEKAALGPAAKARATRMFERLAEAEAAVHDSTLEKVHLHEVGAIDSIIDIVGSAFAMGYLSADRVVVSPVNVGAGMVKTAHGVFPVPAPATVRLLGSLPTYSSGVQFEMLTPTGALILSEYATDVGPMPAMRVSRVGYGAGDRELTETPNIVRVFVGEADASAPALRVAVLACEIDDMNPQIFGEVMDRLYAVGALEVFYQPVQMKKNRPGVMVSVLCVPEREDAIADVLLRETSTLGLRVSPVTRHEAAREILEFESTLGPAAAKVKRLPNEPPRVAPEYEACRKLAEQHALPLAEVYRLVEREALQQLNH